MKENTHCCLQRNQQLTFRKLLEIFISIPLIAIGLVLFMKIFMLFYEKNPELDLKILSSSFSCENQEKGSNVSVIGMIENQGKRRYGNVYFNLSLLDSNGKLSGSDTVNQKKLYIPRKTKASFAIEYQGKLLCEQYQDIELKIVNSDILERRSSNDKN